MTAEIYVHSLFIYPIKSCGGIELTSARIEERGFQHDRRWALLDEHGVIMDQIKYPLLASVRLALASDALVAQAPEMEELRIPFGVEQSLPPVAVKGFRDIFEARRVGEQADGWFSRIVHAPCRLVYMPEATRRAVNPAFAINNDIVSFASGYPFHLMNMASLAYVNQLLASPVPMNRFRPSIVIAGAPALVEDQWQTIKIHDSVFHLVKPCDRCAITTVDQVSGKVTGTEPLRTLARIRTVDKKVLFGQYLLAEERGTIHVGDAVSIVQTRVPDSETPKTLQA